MNVFLKGHALRYDVGEALINLLPAHTLRFPEEEPETHCGDWILSSIVTENDKTSAYAECMISGRSGRSGIAFSGEDGAAGRAARHAVKRSIFLAVKEALGISPPWGALTGVRPSKLMRRFLETESEREALRIFGEDYYVSRGRSEMALEAARFAMSAEARFSKRDVLLYVGIPFCPTRCRYCSFVSQSIEKAGHLIEPYLHALTREMALYSGVVARKGLRVRAVYIGGGTPTSLKEPEFQLLLSSLLKNFSFSDSLEFTVEAGRPDTLNKEKLRMMTDAGVTRISINPQSMSDEVLLHTGRAHTAADVEAAFALAREAGIRDINMDLICGLPEDTEERFLNSIFRVTALYPENITLHLLALKRGADLKSDEAKAALSERGRALLPMLDKGRRMIYDAGFAPYYLYRQKYTAAPGENTGFSLPGRECVYNSLVMEETVPVLSLGAGGMTKLTRNGGREITRLKNHKFPHEYNADRGKIEALAEETERFFEGVQGVETL